jgi:hypothetical protein
LGALIIGLGIAIVGFALYAIIHPVRFVITTVQWILTIAGLVMLYFSINMGLPLGPAWASIFFIITVVLFFGANRVSLLKARLIASSVR